MSYSMTCSCGDTMTVEAENRDEAVVKIKDRMSEDAVARHMELNHPGEAIPTAEQTESMIENNLREAA